MPKVVRKKKSSEPTVAEPASKPEIEVPAAAIPMPEEKSEIAKKSFPRKPFLYGGIIILVLLALTPAYYFYQKYVTAQAQLKNPATASQAEARVLLDRIGALIDLPTSETPTIATVSDITKLKGQTFFAHAQNGDKVLIYTKSKKAILYRPSTNKIIEVGPVNINQNAQSPQPSTSITPSTQSAQFKVALYNGTSVIGLTTAMEKQLKGKIANIVVVSKDNAKKSDYAKSTVIDLMGSQPAVADQLAQAAHATVGTLPSGEIKPKDADFLLIIGSDNSK